MAGDRDERKLFGNSHPIVQNCALREVTNVTALTEGVQKTMLLNKLKFSVATLVAAAFLVSGLLTVIRSSAAFAAPVPKDAGKVAERKIEDIPQLDELVKNRKVVRELKCTAEQRVTIEDQFDDLDEAFEKREKAFNLLKPDNLDDLLEMLDAERKREIAKLAQKLVTTTFKPQQIERLHQIDLQTRGPVAFKDAKVAKALGLSDADKQRIAQAVEKFRDAAEDLDEDDDIIKAARETAKGIVESLTKEQQDAWKKLIGEPVAFEILERLTPDDE